MAQRQRRSVVLLFLAILCACGICIGLNVFVLRAAAQSGILTLKFSTERLLGRGLAGIGGDNVPVVSNIHPVSEAVATGVARATATAAAEAHSITHDIQSVASDAAGAVSSAIRRNVPQNISLGTQQFCVGYGDHDDCRDLPLNMTRVLPSALVVGAPGVFAAVDENLQKLQPGLISALLVSGVVMLLVLSVFLAGFVWGPTAVHCLHSSYLSALLILCGLAALSVFLAPTAVLYMLLQQSHRLPSFVELHRGAVAGSCLGSCLCAAFVLALTTVIVNVNRTPRDESSQPARDPE